MPLKILFVKRFLVILLADTGGVSFLLRSFLICSQQQFPEHQHQAHSSETDLTEAEELSARPSGEQDNPQANQILQRERVRENVTLKQRDVLNFTEIMLYEPTFMAYKPRLLCCMNLVLLGVGVVFNLSEEPRVHKISARNSGAGNGCASCMGAWHFWFFLLENPHAHKIPPFGRGGGVGVVRGLLGTGPPDPTLESTSPSPPQGSIWHRFDIDFLI